jgi:hypothetical protein
MPTCFIWLRWSASNSEAETLTGREADRVTEAALANYVVNSDPDGIGHGCARKPLLAVAACYVTVHFALDLVDEGQAEAILNDCEEHLDEDIP